MAMTEGERRKWGKHRITLMYHGQKYRVTEQKDKRSYDLHGVDLTMFHVQPRPKSGRIMANILKAAHRLREQRATYRYASDLRFLKACGIVADLGLN